MQKGLKKVLLLSAKLLIATVLVVWVLSRSHWRDYVVEKETHKTYAVVASRGAGGQDRQFDVSRGILWWRTVHRNRPESDFDDSMGLVRPGFASSIKGIKVGYMLLGWIGFPISLTIIALRWCYLMRIQDIHVRPWEAVRLTFLGQFFNAIVPGTVGGDLVKAYYAAKHTPKKGAVLVSIFADRVLGLTELTLVAAIMLGGALVFSVAHLSDPGIRKAAVAAVVVIALVIGMLLFLLSSRFRRMLHLQPLYRRLSIAHHIDAAGEAAKVYSRRPGALLKSILITFCAHLAWIGSLVFLGKSLSLPTPAYAYFVYIPLIYIIGAVPITPGGVGLIEDLYMRFFAAAGLASTVLAFALLARLIPVFWGLPGLWVAMTGAKVPKAEAMEAELGLAAGEVTSSGGETITQIGAETADK